MSALPPRANNASADRAPEAPESAVCAEHPSWPEVEWIHPEARIVLPTVPSTYQALKPTLDFVFALLIAVPALPLIGLSWLLIRLTSTGPGFYSQVRSGLEGRPYRILKLRTMVHNIESKTGIQWSTKGDHRITRVGRFLRATHLDELPQLINVLRGEMSLVGPRPERPEVIDAKGLKRMVPGYELRLSVKPGVTGLAQLQLPPDSNLATVKHKVAYDLYYIAHQSLWLDLRLIVATAMKTTGLKARALRLLFGFPRREIVGQFVRQAASQVESPKGLGDSTGLQTA